MLWSVKKTGRESGSVGAYKKSPMGTCQRYFRCFKTMLQLKPRKTKRSRILLIWLLIMIMLRRRALRLSPQLSYEGDVTTTTTASTLPTSSSLSTNEYWTPTEQFTLSPDQWRVWLERYLMKTSSFPYYLTNIKSGTVYGGGCGVSMVVDFNAGDNGINKNKNRNKGFFKVQYGDMNYHHAESHLREIKASYLDWILGTELTTPCVGHRLTIPMMQRIYYQKREFKTIFDNLQCINNSSPHIERRYTSNSVVEGSMMLWLEGIKDVTKKKIIKAARKHLHESALNHAAFHYLGACMKSKFNFFYYKPANRYVAIDNDRCFTPEAIINSPRAVEDKLNRITVWKNLTYELACHLPSKLQQLLLSTTTTITTSSSMKRDLGGGGGGGGGGGKHISSTLSNRLIAALKDDVLGDQLIASQPEAFEELDQRVYELATHIKRNCVVSNTTIST